jgi:hypothetical protein
LNDQYLKLRLRELYIKLFEYSYFLMHTTKYTLMSALAMALTSAMTYDDGNIGYECYSWDATTDEYSLSGVYGASFVDVGKSHNKNEAGSNYNYAYELTLVGLYDADGTETSYYCN